MSSEERSFYVHVAQNRDVSIKSAFQSHCRVIKILYHMLTGTRWGDGLNDITIHDVCFVGHQQITVGRGDFLYHRPKYTKKLAELLTKMRVPEFEQPRIIDKVFMAVEQADNPDWPIICRLGDFTLFPGIKERSLVFPAGCIVRVSIDSLEDDVRQTECVICRERLDHFEDVDEEIDDRGERVIFRLSCSHLFHQYCFASWIVLNQSCPVCRYLMPFVEESDVEQSVPVVGRVMEEVAEQSWRSWPMLLTASAGAITIAMLVCRLFKQSRV